MLRRAVISSTRAHARVEVRTSRGNVALCDARREGGVRRARASVVRSCARDTHGRGSDPTDRARARARREGWRRARDRGGVGVRGGDEWCFARRRRRRFRTDCSVCVCVCVNFARVGFVRDDARVFGRRGDQLGECDGFVQG